TSFSSSTHGNLAPLPELFCETACTTMQGQFFKSPFWGYPQGTTRPRMQAKSASIEEKSHAVIVPHLPSRSDQEGRRARVDRRHYQARGHPHHPHRRVSSGAKQHGPVLVLLSGQLPTRQAGTCRSLKSTP